MIAVSAVPAGSLAGKWAAGFTHPPPEFGPVPFWWWVGDALQPDRLEWQLDQLRSGGVHSAIVSYSHFGDGSTDRGDPPVFSAAWWELFRRIVAACRERGMQLGFQDYMLGNPILQEIGGTTSGMCGGQLEQVSGAYEGPAACRLTAPPGAIVVTARAYPMTAAGPQIDGSIDVSAAVREGELTWSVPHGRWLISLIWTKPSPFDPLHPEAGALVIERLYAPFARHCPGDLGRTITTFFQDELDFGARMPLWTARLPAEFHRRFGYDLLPRLAALWHDLGPVTAKVRIDFSDLVTQLLEDGYFIPVFKWHEAHGTLWGNDNCGRGGIEAGRSHYGDYFRTMRWFSAPGTDDPKLGESRAFKGLKVNSSIAHLYCRPRVWNECFHSSGWGSTPAEVLAAVNQDFVFGATVVNLHGLYYSTFGSWWEWAPPDFHFRQPYWRHLDGLNRYVSRLCWLLSRGNHVCDVAIVYPITSLEAGLGRRVAATDRSGSLSERQAGKVVESLDEAEVHSFGLSWHLFNAGIDFDFIDFQSLERAVASDGQLHVSGESYRVLILPALSAVRFSTLQVAREFQRAGGMVIAFGVLPQASEHAGQDDPELAELVREIFGAEAGRSTPSTQRSPDGGGRGVFVPENYRTVEQAINNGIERDFIAGVDRLHILHRRSAAKDIYCVFNPGDTAIETTASFRATGEVQRWDGWTGQSSTWKATASVGDRTTVPLRLSAFEAQIVVFDRSRPVVTENGDRDHAVTHPTARGEDIPLGGEWGFNLVPTMDNRHGDFRLPAEDGLMGPEARRFRFAEESFDPAAASSWHLTGWDDSGWPLVTCSFGPRFWRLGPIPPGADVEKLAERLAALTRVDAAAPVEVDGREYRWQPHSISLRWGVENDPFLQDWSSGPHGLKGAVPDEFIDLHCDEAGATWFLWTSARPHAAATLPLVAGSRSAYAIWVNGRRVLEQSTALPPGMQSVWDLPHYCSEPQRTSVALSAGENPMLLRFTQPAQQRVRAYAAFALERSHEEPPVRPDALCLRWFASGEHPVLDPRPGRPVGAAWFRFTSPPGLKSLRVTSRGPIRVWVDGEELSVERERLDEVYRVGGAYRYRALVASPRSASAVVAVRVVPPSGSYGGDVLPEPIRLSCVGGRAALCDWSELGLACYSGIACYSRSFDLTAEQAASVVALDLGNVAATAGVRLNGRSVATCVAPPWQVDLTGQVEPGRNRLEVEVANTLANHYSIGIPTPYVYPGQTRSGLFGPVHLRIGAPLRGRGMPAHV